MTFTADFLLSLPTWLGCGVAMATTAGVGFVVYLVFVKFISKYQSYELKDPINNVFRVVGLLVGLMLALSFSEVISELKTIRRAVQQEAVAISDIFEGIKLYDIDKTRELRAILFEYSKAVINDEWSTLADDSLSQQVESFRRQFAEAVINLKSVNSTQEKLMSFIIADFDALSDFRIIRLNSALAEPPVFTYIIIFGYLVTMACFGVYPPQTPLVVLISFYTFFIGLVLYLILQLSDPFQGDIGVSARPFEHLVDFMKSEIR
jgi:hypothetical protein